VAQLIHKFLENSCKKFSQGCTPQALVHPKILAKEVIWQDRQGEFEK
jgi:hypothetical protein